jgi:hypothetical protein
MGELQKVRVKGDSEGDGDNDVWLLDLDDNLAFGASSVDVGQGLVGGVKREHFVDNGTDRTRFDQG